MFPDILEGAPERWVAPQRHTPSLRRLDLHLLKRLSPPRVLVDKLTIAVVAEDAVEFEHPIARPGARHASNLGTLSRRRCQQSLCPLIPSSTSASPEPTNSTFTRRRHGDAGGWILRSRSRPLPRISSHVRRAAPAFPPHGPAGATLGLPPTPTPTPTSRPLHLHLVPKDVRRRLPVRRGRVCPAPEA